jgi:spore coat protein YsxE
LSKLKTILHYYGIYPYYSEPLTNKAIKIYTGNQYIVLKRSNKQPFACFPTVYKLAKEKQLDSIIPIYLTKYHSFGVQDGKTQYYIMPWIKEKMDDINTPRFPQIFKEIGHIHQKTGLERKVNPEQFEPWIFEQKSRVKKFFHTYEKWISAYEVQEFISPAELLLLHLYPQVRELCQSLEYWYDQWLENLQEEKVIRYSLCHGAFFPEHVLIHEQGIFFLNWEKAYFSQPINDLVQYIGRVCPKSDVNMDLLWQGVQTYQTAYSMSKSDYASFVIALFQFKQIIPLIRSFVKQRKLLTEMEWVRKFQILQIYYSNISFLHLKIKENLERVILEEDV